MDASGTTGEPPERSEHEQYGFVCTRCGHGWVREYTIDHHVDGQGRPVLAFHSGGTRVTSPFSRVECERCGGTTVRVLSPGRVTAALAQEIAYHRR